MGEPQSSAPEIGAFSLTKVRWGGGRIGSSAHSRGMSLLARWRGPHRFVEQFRKDKNALFEEVEKHDLEGRH